MNVLKLELRKFVVAMEKEGFLNSVTTKRCRECGETKPDRVSPQPFDTRRASCSLQAVPEQRQSGSERLVIEKLRGAPPHVFAVLTLSCCCSLKMRLRRDAFRRAARGRRGSRS
jgi:hypothetical protein